MNDWLKRMEKLSDSGILFLIVLSGQLKNLGEINLTFVVKMIARVALKGEPLNFLERELLGKLLKKIAYKETGLADALE